MKRLLTLWLLVTATALAQQSTTDNHWLRLAHAPQEVSTEAFVAQQEGLRLTPYHDAAGFPTICVGHKLSDERGADLSQWQPRTRDECLALLKGDLTHFEATVQGVIEVDLAPNQHTALVSLAYNIGPGAFSMSALVTLINGGAEDWHIVLEWTSWDKAHIDGRLQVVDGLLERRRREVSLFFGGGQ